MQPTMGGLSLLGANVPGADVYCVHARLIPHRLDGRKFRMRGGEFH